MKKIIAGILVATMVLCTVAPVQAETAKGRGGCVGFFVGCCLGMRASGEWNEGKHIQWREWTPLIPYAGLIFRVWNGIDGASGITRADFAEKYGSIYY